MDKRARTDPGTVPGIAGTVVVQGTAAVVRGTVAAVPGTAAVPGNPRARVARVEGAPRRIGGA